MPTEKEKTDKQNILANLYSLRAGISLACTLKDKADSIIQKAKKERDKIISQSQDELNGIKGEAEQIIANKKEAESQLAQTESALVSEYKSLKWRKKAKMKSTFIFSLVMLGILALAAIMLYCAFYFLVGAGVFGYDVKDGSVLDILYGWMYLWHPDPNYKGSNSPERKYGIAGFLDVVSIILVLAAIAGIIFLILVARNKGDDMMGDVYSCKKCKNNIGQLAEESARLRRAIADYGEDGELATSDTEDCKAQLARVKQETTAILDKATKDATPYVKTTLALVEVLDSTFTDLIDIRDWENLDYILYCLETRRADNMKEALAAVDRQRQTEQIVSAVEAAGREISRTLNTAMKRLENRMVQCFTVISKQLEVQSRQLSTISGQLDDIVSAQSMSNALLTMQNVTSMAMLGELNKISSATSYVAGRISDV